MATLVQVVPLQKLFTRPTDFYGRLPTLALVQWTNMSKRPLLVSCLVCARARASVCVCVCV